MDDSLQRTDAVNFKIDDILELVRKGQIRIPRFQRGIRWTEKDVERLFDSIYRGYPLGSLLFWRRPAPAETVVLGSVIIEAAESSNAMYVVDGQQRISTLAQVLLPGQSSAQGELVFDLATERFIFEKPNERRENRLPIRQAYDLQRVLTWARERNISEIEQGRAFRLADRLRNSEIPAYVVEASDEAPLRDIFDRMNTFGKQMTRAEVFHALNSAASSDKQDLRTLADEVEALGYGTLRDNTLLYCVLSVRGSDVLREFRSEFPDGKDLQEALSLTRISLERTVSFLRTEAMVPHLDLVPYQYLLVGLTRYFAVFPSPSDHALVILRRWFWRSAVHGPIARVGSTGTLRATTAAITPGSDERSALALLNLPDAARAEVRLGPFKWTNSDTRIGLAALASLNPLDVLSHRRVPVTESITRLGRDAARLAFRLRGAPSGNLLANRIFVGADAEDASSLTFDELSTQIASADPDTLATHLITPGLIVHLRDGDVEGFVNERQRLLTDLVSTFVDSLAEWERAGRVSIGAYVSYDDELDDDEPQEL